MEDDIFDEETAQEPARATPPKDPVTGRFVPVEPAEQLSPPPNNPKHAQGVVNLARELGLEDDEISSTPSGQLERTVYALFRQREKLRSELNVERLRQDATVQTPDPKSLEEEDDLGLNPEVEPTILNAFKRLQKENKELKAKLGRVDDLDKQFSQHKFKTASDLLDAAFAKLPAKYRKLFGDGAASDLGPNQQRELKRRLAVLQEAGITFDNINRGTIIKKIKDAADSLYALPEEQPVEPTEPPDPYSRAIAQPKKGQRITPEQWDEAATAVPSQRRGAGEPNGEQKAVANLARKMREQESMSDAEIDDGLL